MSPGRSGRRRLTVATIVRDAAPLLDETLRSVRHLADELVVLDTGSSDATHQVARRFAAALYTAGWTDDFAAARNRCFEHVKGDWVLWLDAGETLSSADAHQLREFIDAEADSRTAYLMLVKVPRGPAHVDGEQVARLRLMPNHPGLRYRGRVRESLGTTLASSGVSLAAVSARIHRGDGEHEVDRRVRRARRNIYLAELERKEAGEDARLLNCLAEAHQVLGDSLQAHEFYRRALRASGYGSAEMLEAYYGLLTTFDSAGSGGDSYLALFLEALTPFPLDVQLLCAMGGHLQRQGRLDLAARAYETAHKYGQVNPEVWHLDRLYEIATACHAFALQLAQRDGEAIEVLETSLRSDADSGRLRRQLVELYLKNGCTDAAESHVRCLADDPADVQNLIEVIRGAKFARQKDWPVALQHLQAAYGRGCRDPLCLRWLVFALVAEQDYLRAKQLVAEWQGADPASLELQALLQSFPQLSPRPATEDFHRVDHPHSPFSPTSEHVGGDPRAARPPIRGARVRSASAPASE